MKPFIFVACAVASVLLSSASVAGESLSGFWTGSYSYGHGDEGVAFSAVIRSEPQARFFQGVVIEPNTFAGGGAVALQADVKGRLHAAGPKAEADRAAVKGKRIRIKGKGKDKRGAEAKVEAPSSSGGVRVEFVKTYDGTGGASHSVWYSGRFDPESHEIKGTWDLGEGSQGTFVMKRAAGQ
jgi:hypothetical protein